MPKPVPNQISSQSAGHFLNIPNVIAHASSLCVWRPSIRNCNTGLSAPSAQNTAQNVANTAESFMLRITNAFHFMQILCKKCLRHYTANYL